jgi:hypothetical protein
MMGVTYASLAGSFIMENDILSTPEGIINTVVGLSFITTLSVLGGLYLLGKKPFHEQEKKVLKRSMNDAYLRSSELVENPEKLIYSPFKEYLQLEIDNKKNGVDYLLFSDNVHFRTNSDTVKII